MSTVEIENPTGEHDMPSYAADYHVRSEPSASPRSMPLTIARSVARSFIAGVTKPDREWTVKTVAAYLPPSWELPDYLDDGDFHPVTIKNIAGVLSRHARSI